MSRRGRGPLDVAIVGMGCRFPGAPDLVTYWENILAGRSAIGDVPKERWNSSVFCDPSLPDSERVASRRGGYLDFEIPIDPTVHGVMPRSLDGGEPESHLVFDAARSALADAGLDEESLDGRRVEVVVGRGNYFNRGNLTRLQHGRILEQTIAIARVLRPDLSQDDLHALRDDLKSQLPRFDAAAIPGQLTNGTAGRTANRLDLRGASFVVDAASASSLVSLDLGARALVEGRADVAIVGGVYIQSDVDFPMVFSRIDALSRSGESRPFSREADGLVPGEGVGIVVIKRLDDAVAQNDRIYAVVKAVGIASDGRGRGLASPSVRGHTLAMRRAYRNARIDPGSIGLIEAHGLGLPAAELDELKAIRAVFPPSETRMLGAVSSMIGHAMPASGVAGLIKAALALYHRVLPPTLNVEKPRSSLNRADRRCTPNRKPRPWVHGESNAPRRAAVNAFGFAGINAHAILEEHRSIPDEGPGCLVRWDSEAILISAVDRGSLVRRLNVLASQIERRPDASLKDLAFTLNRDHQDGPFRVGLVVTSKDDLISRLRALAVKVATPSCDSIRDARGTYFRGTTGGPPRLAVVFPGEGSQYRGMLGELALHFPSVLDQLDIADRVAIDSGAADRPSRLLYGEVGDEDHGLWSIATAVNVVLSAQWAMYRLLRSLDVKPDAVVGHSSGEFLALAAAGSISVDRSFENALGKLGRVFSDQETARSIPKAVLLAVASDRERVESIARGLDIAVAIDNCPHQVVLAGTSQPIEEMKERLNADGIVFEILPFDRGYHTESFKSAVGPLGDLLDQSIETLPNLPIYSCASADPMPASLAEIRRLARDQWSRTVEFRSTITRMHTDGYEAFIDVGPRGHLAAAIEDSLRGRGATAIAMGLPRRSGVSQINHVVATLHTLGFDLDLKELYVRRRPEAVDLDWLPPPPPEWPTLRLGFPEMMISDAMAKRLTRRVQSEVVATEASPPGPLSTHQSVEDPMLDYLRTMNRFLETQRQVMGNFLASPVAASPNASVGPWAGEVVSIESGQSVTTRLTLCADGDPVAAHHTLGGRRVSSVGPDRLGLPVLPFAVMAEMLAQVASILAPGLVLQSLRDVVAHRWIRYEDEAVILELQARQDPADPGVIQAAIYNRGPQSALRPCEAPVVEGVAVFAGRGLDPVASPPFVLPSPTSCKFTAKRLYEEQWLFHGPALQAVEKVRRVSDRGIEGVLRILPRGALLRDPSQAPGLWIDPIILDNFTHLLGCWGLDRLDGGDVVFPLRMGELSLHGDSPQDGELVSCEIMIDAVEHHRVKAHAQVVRPDGTLWMSIQGWEDWRFHWPARYRDVFRRPDVELLGEPLQLKGGGSHACAVWLQPPPDMGRPVWRDVLEQIQLSLAEMKIITNSPASQRALRLWGRIAAKDAARRLLDEPVEVRRFPADLEILPDAHGKPILRSLGENREAMPAISIAHTDGVAVALATADPMDHPGIDVEPIVSRSADFEATAFVPGELRLLDLASRDGDRDAWVARFWCAKEAAAKATGLGFRHGPRSAEIVGLGPMAGEVIVALTSELDLALPGTPGTPIGVMTETRQDHAWAWTLGTRRPPG